MEEVRKDEALPVLVIIPYSHFCARATWALERAGLPFTERRVLPLLHIPVVRWYHKATRVASRASSTGSPFATPFMLVPGGGHPVGVPDSDEILLFVDSALVERGDPPLSLPSTPPYDAFMRDCCEALGPAVRAIAYDDVLPSFTSMARLASRNGCSAWESTLWACMWPLNRVFFTVMFKLNSVALGEAEATVRRVFSAANALLGAQEERRRAGHGGAQDGAAVYLFGDRFSAADLTFAALGAVIADVPGEHRGYWVPPLTGTRARTLAEWCKHSAAGQHIHRMHREQRARVAVPSGK